MKRIIEEVSAKYCLDDADILEAGCYPPKELDFLGELYHEFMKNSSAENFRNYLEAKAQFILAR